MEKATLTRVKRNQWIQGSIDNKSSSENKVRKTFYINRDSYQKLRKRAFDLEMPMSRILNTILEEKL